MSQHNRPRRTPGGEEVEDHGGMVRGGGRDQHAPKGAVVSRRRADDAVGFSGSRRG